MGPGLRRGDGFKANDAGYVTPANAGAHSERQKTVQMALSQPAARTRVCSTLVTT
jgi:hypothetical protein